MLVSVLEPFQVVACVAQSLVKVLENEFGPVSVQLLVSVQDSCIVKLVVLDCDYGLLEFAHFSLQTVNLLSFS